MRRSAAEELSRAARSRTNAWMCVKMGMKLDSRSHWAQQYESLTGILRQGA